MSPNSKMIDFGMHSICFSFIILVFIKKRETWCKNNPAVWRGVKIPKSMTAKCVNVGGCLSSKWRKFLSSVRSHISR